MISKVCKNDKYYIFAVILIKQSVTITGINPKTQEIQDQRRVFLPLSRLIIGWLGVVCSREGCLLVAVTTTASKYRVASSSRAVAVVVCWCSSSNEENAVATVVVMMALQVAGAAAGQHCVEKKGGGGWSCFCFGLNDNFAY